MRLDDEGGTGCSVARRKLISREDGGLVPVAVRIKLGPSRRGGEWRARGRDYRLFELCAATNRLDRNRLHHQFLGLIDEPEPRFMRGLESRFHGGESRPRLRRARAWARRWERPPHPRGIGSGLTHTPADEHFDGIGPHALLDHFASCFVPQSAADAFDRCERALSEWLLDRLLARGADVGESHAIGGKK